jgi:serine/threonine protein kinase
LPEGTRIGEFQITGRLGKGGMGDVYLAVQQSMGRPVALKIMSAAFSESELAVARFQKETQLLGRLNHPNIVSAYGAGEEDGFHFLAMAYIDGETLRARLKREGALAEREVLLIGLRLATALAYAWGQFQLLHRDIKPENIMVTPEGQVLLMDLGISKSGDESENVLTNTGDAIGTPYYMSPELFRGERDLDERCDIFSLGATLYHLVTGRRPFTGDGVVAIFEAMLHTAPTAAHVLRSGVSEATGVLLARMLEPDRNKRPTDWSAMEAELARVIHDLPEDASELQDLDAPTIRIPRLADKGKKTSPARARTITLLLSLLAAIAAFVLLREPGAAVPKVIESVAVAPLTTAPEREPEAESPAPPCYSRRGCGGIFLADRDSGHEQSCAGRVAPHRSQAQTCFDEC